MFLLYPNIKKNNTLQIIQTKILKKKKKKIIYIYISQMFCQQYNN